jgi:hypothetical protein
MSIAASSDVAMSVARSARDAAPDEFRKGLRQRLLSVKLELAPALDWDSQADTLRQGDVTGLDASTRAAVEKLATDLELVRVATEISLAPLLLAIAVLAARDAPRVRSAERVFRALVPAALRTRVQDLAKG